MNKSRTFVLVMPKIWLEVSSEKSAQCINKNKNTFKFISFINKSVITEQYTITKSTIHKLFSKIPTEILSQIKDLTQHTNLKQPKMKISKALRCAVWTKYIGKDIGTSKCLCCNIKEISCFDFECGHVVAESKGGPTNIENLRPICSICNNSMGTTDMNEFKNKFF